MEAVGLIETVGSSSAIIIADKMLKTALVSYECWHTKCGGHVLCLLHCKWPHGALLLA